MRTFLSIDFEDFSHDLKRSLNVWETGPLRITALWNSYNEINTFLSEVGGEKSSKVTFFCTAIIAKEAPDLINKIASDGHEIACHYFFHDDMYLQEKGEIELMLGKAKDELEKASGKEVKGFRAPKFNISKSIPDQYLAVEKFFSYDSSLAVNALDEIDVFKQKMGLESLEILPIFWESFLGQKMKLGGSYLKLFPKKISKKLILNAKKKGINPHIYLHPYEFNSLQEYRVSFKELNSLGFLKSGYWTLRQFQWLRIGNNSLKDKIRLLIEEEGLGGTLKDGLLKK